MLKLSSLIDSQNPTLFLKLENRLISSFLIKFTLYVDKYFYHFEYFQPVKYNPHDTFWQIFYNLVGLEQDSGMAKFEPNLGQKPARLKTSSHDE